MGRGPALASGGEGAEEGDRAAVEVGREDGAASHQPVDDAGSGVAATARDPGPVAGADQAVATRGAAVDRETDSSVVAADGGTAPGADGAPVRRGAAGRRHEEGGLRAPQRAARHNDGGRLRRVVGRHRRRAVQGQVPGGDSAVLQRVLRQGVSGRAARVAARRHRVGVPLLRGPRGPPRARQHLAGGQGRVGGPGPGADRGVRGVPGRVSVPGGVLRAGQGLGEGFCGGRCEIRPEPGVPAAAGSRELDGPQRGGHHGAGGRPADAPARRRAPGRGSVGAGAAAPAGDARAPSRHVPRRRAGGRQVRARPRGPGDVLGADPPRLPAGVGEAVSRPGGDRGRRRGGRRASPGVRPGREGPRCASRPAVARAQAPGRGRGDGASRLAAGPGVAAGAGGAGQAHAQARSGMGPDAAADGDPPGRGRRARGGGRPRTPPRLETVRLILRQQEAGPPLVCPPVASVRPELARIAVPAPTLSAYDALVEGSC